MKRREFLLTSGAIFVMPSFAGASDMFKKNGIEISVHPISHASIVLETPAGVIYVDPVGEVKLYEAYPKPNLILITHHHGDHYNAETLAALKSNTTEMIVNPEVFSQLPDALKTNTRAIANGEDDTFNHIGVKAIPAYNTSEGRMDFHPKGRDNGYVLDFDGFRIYVSGDTEDIPEMRTLKDIDLCFLCMNLPFTMTAEQAASAVAEFKPKAVYPYHYRGRDGGTQDPAHFAELVGKNAEVKLYDWYNGALGDNHG